jgi:hypothetical protein
MDLRANAFDCCCQTGNNAPTKPPSLGQFALKPTRPQPTTRIPTLETRCVDQNSRAWTSRSICRCDIELTQNRAPHAHALHRAESQCTADHCHPKPFSLNPKGSQTTTGSPRSKTRRVDRRFGSSMSQHNSPPCHGRMATSDFWVGSDSHQTHQVEMTVSWEMILGKEWPMATQHAQGPRECIGGE